ncbi:MAG: TlpA disulfide reductase family protein [Vicinamibacterales bacterium]
MGMLPAVIVAMALLQAPGAPAGPPQTPADCVRDARAFAVSRQRAVPTLTAAVVRQIEQEKIARARACAAAFDPATAPADTLADLIALYQESDEPARARAALDRAMRLAPSLPAGQYADVLLQAVVSGLREPKSPARNARLEALVDRLDGLSGGVLDRQVAAHQRMNGYYRGDDIDAGIIRHSTWLIDHGRVFTPDQRREYGATVVIAHINMAEAWAGQGRTTQAVALLERALDEWSDVATTRRMVEPVLARYRLVGTMAAPIEAPVWLNAPAGTTTMPMTGAVTLLEFTAHWCGPCRESYPGLKRLLARFGARGFRVVLATELYGYFQEERGLDAATEIARDRAYFAGEGLEVPTAIAPRRAAPVRGPDGSYAATMSANDDHYQVGGIPQIQIIDRSGRIRRILVGYDDANEADLAALIASLLGDGS